MIQTAPPCAQEVAEECVEGAVQRQTTIEKTHQSGNDQRTVHSGRRPCQGAAQGQSRADTKDAKKTDEHNPIQSLQLTDTAQKQDQSAAKRMYDPSQQRRMAKLQDEVAAVREENKRLQEQIKRLRDDNRLLKQRAQGHTAAAPTARPRQSLVQQLRERDEQIRCLKREIEILRRKSNQAYLQGRRQREAPSAGWHNSSTADRGQGEVQVATNAAGMLLSDQ